MSKKFRLPHRLIGHRVKGSPFQPGDVVRVQVIDDEVSRQFVGRFGKVVGMEYSCGCGQTFPTDPMVRVRFRGRQEEFWKEELAIVSRAHRGSR
jgi:hypothetical protein